MVSSVGQMEDAIRDTGVMANKMEKEFTGIRKELRE